MNHPIIIEQANLQNLPARLFSTSLSLGWWLFFIYLWLPLLEPWKQQLGISFLLQDHMFTAEGFGYVAKLFLFCGFAALVISLIFASWSWYNYKRFHYSRRRRPPALKNDALAEHFKVQQSRLQQWQHVKRIRVDHDEHGNIYRVQTLGTGPLTKKARTVVPATSTVQAKAS